MPYNPLRFLVVAMSTLDAVHVQHPPISKRKHFGDGHDPLSKKPRVAMGDPTPTTSHYFAVHEPLLAKLHSSYAVKTMSVMPSTSINKHVDKALQHLGRFSAWDQSVLPGVVFFSAGLKASNKLVTIAELVRRRIGESEEKWYQYNILTDMECEETSTEGPLVVEDTFLAVDEGDPDSATNDYFETMKPTVHEQAVAPVKTRHRSYMSLFLSRVPLGELKALPNVGLQTNEDNIELIRKRKTGAVA